MSSREGETESSGEALLEKRASAGIAEVIAGLARLEDRLERLRTRLAADD